MIERVFAMTITWKKDFFLGVSVIGLISFIYYRTLQMRPQDVYYVRIILVCLLALSIQLFWKTYKTRKKEIKSDDQQDTEPFMNFKQVFLAVMIFLYVFFLRHTGFLVSSLLFVSITAYVLGFRNKLKLFALTISVTGVIYYIFFMWLRIRGIPGIWFS